MNPESKDLKGFKPYSIDSKFRVAVPPAWRPPAGMPIYLMYSCTYEMPMLKVITEEGYLERVAIVERSSLSEGKKRHKLGVLSSRCRDATINDQGKLTIPKDLAEDVGIEPDSDVILIGRRGHFEVWKAESGKRARAIEMAEPDEEELGIF